MPPHRPSHPRSGTRGTSGTSGSSHRNHPQSHRPRLQPTGPSRGPRPSSFSSSSNPRPNLQPLIASGGSSGLSLPTNTTAQPIRPPAPIETYESEENRARAAYILDHWELLASMALATGESVPQIRRRQERILIGLPASPPPPTMNPALHSPSLSGGADREQVASTEWHDENEVPWKEVKHLDEQWRREVVEMEEEARERERERNIIFMSGVPLGAMGSFGPAGRNVGLKLEFESEEWMDG
ncbi:MAG: hypothetical protein MMC33_004945 [Icmadophila ericetorum]|nr:hypothetical protein [Icmadophila ericetorum]